MGLASGLREFTRQVVVLAKKNAILQWRNKASTATQLCIGVFFLFLLLIMNNAVKKLNEQDQYMVETLHPNVVDASSIRNCFGVNCYDFVYAPAETVTNSSLDEALEGVIELVRARLDISESQTLRFENATVMKSWILENQNRTSAAVYFPFLESWLDFSAGGVFEEYVYVLQVNQTKTCAAIGAWGCDDPIAEVAIPLQTSIDGALASYFGAAGSEGASIRASFSDFPHPDMPSNFDVVSSFGPSFLYIAVSFNYVIQLTLIVEEKELHLLEAMKQMGMMYSAYWTSWFLVNTAVNTLMVLLLVAFGSAFKLELFSETATGLLIVFFWLSSMSFTALAFLFSTLTRSTSSARLMGIGIFILTFIAAPIMVSLLMETGDPADDTARRVMSLLPIFSFYHVLDTMIAESSGSSNLGMSWDDRLLNILPANDDGINAVWSIQDSFGALIKGFLIMTALAWYLDHVIPNEYGKRESFIFFLKPSYWLPRGTRRQVAPEGGAKNLKQNNHRRVEPDTAQMDDDVAEEAKNVFSRDFGGREVALVFDNLRKTFPGGMFGVDFHAVMGLDLAIDANSCFVLLGHNGAGKTTTLRMLAGNSDVTHGDISVFGRSIVHDMDEIRQMMGVCPQHDILWDKLTAREHLRLFAVIKGMPAGKIEAEVELRLEQTSLTFAADAPSSSYSGGMKRRLSIAIALIGDPKLVTLDEPTTGMDVETRREVWEMISKAKKGRVIILTTHSMEEADILGDRIGVMSKGRMQALGTSLRLKSKFGRGYRLEVMLSPQADRARIEETFRPQAPEGTIIQAKSSTSSTGDNHMVLQLPRMNESEVLVRFLAFIESSQSSLGIEDLALSLSTLEEVFIRLSQEDHFIAQEEEIAKVPGALTTEFKARNMGTRVQFNALLQKSITYQCKQKTSCCMLTIFPMVIMLLLLALDSALLTPFKLEAMCGSGIKTKEECIESGYDLDCVSQLATYSSPSALSAVVGQISTSGRRGGINPNCDSSGCFTGLEVPRYDQIPIYVSTAAGSEYLGSRSSSQTFEATTARESLAEWWANMNFLLRNDTCEQIYSNHLDESEACADESGADAVSCQARVRSLQSAADYVDSDNGTDTSSAGLGICSRGSDGNLLVPTLSEIVQIYTWQQERDACLALADAQVWAHLASANFSDWFATITAEETIEGLLGEVELPMFTQSYVQTFTKRVLTMLLNGAGSMFQLDPIAGVSYGCDVANSEVFVMASVILSIVSSANLAGIVVDGDKAFQNVCLFAKHLDIVRGLSYNQTWSSASDMRLRGIFDAWGGHEVETELMRSSKEYLLEESQYFAHQYYAHWQAYEIHDISTSGINFTAYYNNSATSNTHHGNWYALVNLIDNAFVKNATGRGVRMLTESFPTAFVCNRDEWLQGEAESLKCDLLQGFLALSVLDFLGITLFPYLLMAHMFVVVNLVVYEKENRLRMIMKMMGLSMRVYWAVNYIFYFTQYILMVLMMWGMGIAANVQTFSLHDSAVVFLVLFSWGNLLVVFAMFLSVFFKSSRTSTAGVFLLMLILNTTGASLLQTLTEDPNTTESAFTFYMLIPPLVMIRAMLWLGLAGAFNEAITLENWNTFADGAVPRCVGFMWMHVILFGLLMWYLDKVLAVGYGVPEHPLFFLNKEYWRPSTNQGTGDLASEPLPDCMKDASMPEDVKAEHERAVRSDCNDLVRVARLHKQYSKDNIAVRSVSLSIREKECFALLGHNGAGKTTTINCLTGLFPPTSGNAMIQGYSIRTALDKIYQRMGVCPQHDIIWETLSGPEHLRFYGRLKGLRGTELREAVKKALHDVNLTYAGNRPAGKYSGGMKRRLSTAISLIADPLVVYLDEPSTGLDPASRQQLIQVISRAKGDKAVVLTTHSMEEADLLADRVGIMSHGLLQCIGTPAELKQRFGKGYTCQITTKEKTEAAHKHVLDFVQQLFPSAKLRNEQLAGTSNFEIDRKEIVLSETIRKIEAARQDLGIIDFGLSATTLEEVFVYLSRNQPVAA